MYLYKFTSILMALTSRAYFRIMVRGRAKKKTSTRKKQSSSAPPVLQSPKKRLKWSNESMEKALQAVKDGQCKIKEAAREFNVPRTTLQDRISGRVVHGVKPGPKPYLNKAEESELAEFLEVTSSVGYGRM